MSMTMPLMSGTVAIKGDNGCIKDKFLMDIRNHHRLSVTGHP